MYRLSQRHARFLCSIVACSIEEQKRNIPKDCEEEFAEDKKLFAEFAEDKKKKNVEVKDTILYYTVRIPGLCLSFTGLCPWAM